MDMTWVIFLFIFCLMSIAVCGVFTFCMGKLLSKLGSLELAIKELKQRDEAVADSLKGLEKFQGVWEIYQDLLNELRDKSEKQGQYIGRLLERSNIHGTALTSIYDALRRNDININNFVADSQQNQVGEGNEQGQR